MWWGVWCRKGLKLTWTSGLRVGSYRQVSLGFALLNTMLIFCQGRTGQRYAHYLLLCSAQLLIRPGTLLTFVQFLFVASTGYISQFDRNRAPHFLKPNKVPIRRWLINILLFFTINVLNNHAFSYNISVPIHIILRSGGSITTLVAGYLWGKRFSRLQVFAVTLLTIGVVIAAWSDQQAKVRPLVLIWESTNNVYRKTSRLLLDFLPSALDLPYFSSPRFCPL